MIRVLIDTNILISAALSSTGTPYAAYMKAVTYPYRGVICDQNVDEIENEQKIRDVKDRPILRAAINADVDILLTGDKDFLEADIEKPRTMTAAEFMKL